VQAACPRCRVPSWPSTRRRLPRADSWTISPSCRTPAAPPHRRRAARAVRLERSGAAGAPDRVRESGESLAGRAAARRREFAIRLALGADRVQLARQLLAESCRLALPGGLAGAVLAAAVVRFLNLAKPLALVRYPEIVLDLRTLLFHLCADADYGLGLRHGARLRGQRHGSAGGAEVRRSRRRRQPCARAARRLLVTGELAVSLVLLIGAGPAGAQFPEPGTRQPGLPRGGLLTLRVNLTGPRYGNGLDSSATTATPWPASRRCRRCARRSHHRPAATGEHAYQSGAVQIAGRVPCPWRSGRRPIVDRQRGLLPRARRSASRGRLFGAQDNERTPDVV